MINNFESLFVKGIPAKKQDRDAILQSIFTEKKTNEAGLSLIHCICQAPGEESVLLLEYCSAFDGFEINTTSPTQQTPLHIAAIAGNVSAVRWLIAHQADPNRLDASHKTALDYAKQQANACVTQLEPVTKSLSPDNPRPSMEAIQEIERQYKSYLATYMHAYQQLLSFISDSSRDARFTFHQGQCTIDLNNDNALQLIAKYPSLQPTNPSLQIKTTGPLRMFAGMDGRQIFFARLPAAERAMLALAEHLGLLTLQCQVFYTNNPTTDYGFGLCTHITGVSLNFCITAPIFHGGQTIPLASTYFSYSATTELMGNLAPAQGVIDLRKWGLGACTVNANWHEAVSFATTAINQLIAEKKAALNPSLPSEICEALDQAKQRLQPLAELSKLSDTQQNAIRLLPEHQAITTSTPLNSELQNIADQNLSALIKDDKAWLKQHGPAQSSTGNPLLMSNQSQSAPSLPVPKQKTKQSRPQI